MTADDLIRAVADAIAAYPSQPDAQARAAIRAVHAAMREPTPEIRAAWAKAVPIDPEMPLDTQADRDWRAMLAASPLAEAARDE
jgi:hypothetical protein